MAGSRVETAEIDLLGCYLMEISPEWRICLIILFLVIAITADPDY